MNTFYEKLIFNEDNIEIFFWFCGEEKNKKQKINHIGYAVWVKKNHLKTKLYLRIKLFNYTSKTKYIIV